MLNIYATTATWQTSASTKACTNCFMVKPISEFSRHKGSPDGHQYWCKQCHREYDAARNERMMHSNEGELLEWQATGLKGVNGYRCMSCDSSSASISLYQIIPPSEGGAKWVTNQQALCKSCSSGHLNDYRSIEIKAWALWAVHYQGKVQNGLEFLSYRNGNSRQ